MGVGGGVHSEKSRRVSCHASDPETHLERSPGPNKEKLSQSRETSTDGREDVIAYDHSEYSEDLQRVSVRSYSGFDEVLNLAQNTGIASM